MGESVPNSTTLWFESGAAVYGLSWSKRSTGQHEFYALTHTRAIELRMKAILSATRAAFESDLITAEQVWWDDQPDAAQDQMWAALRGIPL